MPEGMSPGAQTAERAKMAREHALELQKRNAAANEARLAERQLNKPSAAEEVNPSAIIPEQEKRVRPAA